MLCFQFVSLPPCGQPNQLMQLLLVNHFFCNIEREGKNTLSSKFSQNFHVQSKSHEVSPETSHMINSQTH